MTVSDKEVDAQSSNAVDLLQDAKAVLREHLSRLGLKQSSQREAILRIFLTTRDHLSIEELHNLVRKHDPTIGYTTVYRTLKLFAQCGLAAEVEFHDGIARYERRLHRRSHHHMVCTVCGDSVEFACPEVEEIEHRIAKKFHYTPSRHIFQIYGTCDACKRKLRTPLP
jgi:Fur family ferric uptake transcriptional regulator